MDAVDNFCELQMLFIHVNYNLLGQPVNYSVIPSENCRFGFKDDTCKEINHIAIHPDWAKYDVDTKSELVTISASAITTDDETITVTTLNTIAILLSIFFIFLTFMY